MQFEATQKYKLFSPPFPSIIFFPHHFHCAPPMTGALIPPFLHCKELVVSITTTAFWGTGHFPTKLPH